MEVHCTEVVRNAYLDEYCVFPVKAFYNASKYNVEGVERAKEIQESDREEDDIGLETGKEEKPIEMAPDVEQMANDAPSDAPETAKEDINTIGEKVDEVERYAVFPGA